MTSSCCPLPSALRPLRVALVVPGFQAHAGDWCIPALTNLVRALAARPGVEVDVFALRYPHRRDEYRVNGARVHSFGGGAVAGRRYWAASMGLLWRLFLSSIEREHSRRPFAVVHGFWATESGYLAVRAARRLGVPSLAHLAGGELADIPAIGYGNWREPLAGTLVRFALRGAGRVTVPSQAQMDLLSARYPATMARAVRWSLGVDTGMFVPPSVAGPGQHGKLRVAHVASLLPVKDQQTLLAAFAVARRVAPESSIELSIAGGGPLRGELERMAALLRLQDRVTFQGELPHDALPDFYRAHDIFALTSLHEAQCMAALEAMACGLPWVAPPVGSLLDVVSTGSGWSFERGDAGGLAAALLAAAADAGERIRRGQIARSWVEDNFDLGGTVDRLLGIYGSGDGTRGQRRLGQRAGDGDERAEGGGRRAGDGGREGGGRRAEGRGRGWGTGDGAQHGGTEARRVYGEGTRGTGEAPRATQG